MNRRSVLRLCIVLLLLLFVSGCSKVEQRSGETDNATKQNKSITPTSEIISLADGLSTVNYTGDYGFNDFLIILCLESTSVRMIWGAMLA